MSRGPKGEKRPHPTFKTKLDRLYPRHERPRAIGVGLCTAGVNRRATEVSAGIYFLTHICELTRV
jgi:hypothetical protein